MVALLVLIIATLEMVFGGKICWTQKVYLAITLSKIWLNIYTCMYTYRLLEMSIETDQERFTLRFWCTNDKKVKDD